MSVPTPAEQRRTGSRGLVTHIMIINGWPAALGCDCWACWNMETPTPCLGPWFLTMGNNSLIPPPGGFAIGQYGCATGLAILVMSSVSMFSSCRRRKKLKSCTCRPSGFTSPISPAARSDQSIGATSTPPERRAKTLEDLGAKLGAKGA